MKMLPIQSLLDQFVKVQQVSIAAFKEEHDKVKAELAEVKSGAATKSELAEVKSHAAAKSELVEVKSELAEVKTELAEVKESLSYVEEDLLEVEERDILSRLSGRFTFKRITNGRPVPVWSRLSSKEAKTDADILSKLYLGHRRAHGEFLPIPQRHHIIRNVLEATNNGKNILRKFCAENEPPAMAIDRFLAEHTTCSIQHY